MGLALNLIHTHMWAPPCYVSSCSNAFVTSALDTSFYRLETTYLISNKYMSFHLLFIIWVCVEIKQPHLFIFPKTNKTIHITLAPFSSSFSNYSSSFSISNTLEGSPTTLSTNKKGIFVTQCIKIIMWTSSWDILDLILEGCPLMPSPPSIALSAKLNPKGQCIERFMVNSFISLLCYVLCYFCCFYFVCLNG